MAKKHDNICKFVSCTGGDKIEPSNFVYECNVDVLNFSKSFSSNIMAIVADGEGTIVMGNVKKDLKCGSVFFCFEGVPYKIEETQKMELMYIRFLGKRSSELFERFGISVASPVFEGHEGLLSFWKNAIGKANDKNVDLLSESVLLYTFSQMSVDCDDSKKHIVTSVLKCIDVGFTDASLSLESVSDELGYNPKYISRVFKENMNITFSEHLKNIRIQHAIFLLEHGIISVKNAALLSGYRDPLYFSNVFKKTVGISPGEYIKRNTSRREEEYI